MDGIRKNDLSLSLLREGVIPSKGGLSFINKNSRGGTKKSRALRVRQLIFYKILPRWVKSWTRAWLGLWNLGLDFWTPWTIKIYQIYGYIITLAPIFVRSTFVTNMFLCKNLTYRMLQKSCHNFRAVYLVNDVAFEHQLYGLTVQWKVHKKSSKLPA